MPPGAAQAVRQPKISRRPVNVLSGDAKFRFQFVIQHHSADIPVRFIAELFCVGESTVRREQRRRNVALDFRVGKKLFYRWCRLEALPELRYLAGEERSSLERIWRSERAWWQALRQQPGLHKKRLRRVLAQAKATMGRTESAVEQRRCTKCGESYPLAPQFFRRCRHCRGGFSHRCKVCAYESDILPRQRRRCGETLRRYPGRGKRIPRETRLRMEWAVTSLSQILPTEEIAAIFGVNRALICNIRNELGLALTQVESRVVGKRWRETKSCPRVLGLTEAEQKLIEQRFERRNRCIE